MPLRPKDIQVLTSVRDCIAGEIRRNDLTDAFKRAGATISAFNGALHLLFQGKNEQYNIPLGRGLIDLATPHKTYIRTLKNLAQELLQHHNID
jgi:hypothetical protein